MPKSLVFTRTNSYCVKCRTKTSNVSPHISTTANGRKMLRSVCGVCKTKKCQFVK